MPKFSFAPNRARRSHYLLAAALSAAVSLAADLPQAHADTWTWNGGGASVGNFNWSDTANWFHTGGATSPVSSTDTIISFAGSLGPVPNQDIANPLLLNSLNFQSGAGAFQFSGNALDFATSSASVAPTIVQNSANGTVILNNITLNNNTTLSGSGTGGLLFLGNITGGAALTVTSGGNMTLLGNNTYAGGTTINGGAVVMSSSASLGTGNLTFTSGALIGGNVTMTTNFTATSSAVNFQALPGTTFVINPVHALFGSMNFGSAANTGTINFEPANFTWFGGTINVNGGTLLDGADALSQTLGSYTVNIASGATFNINSFSTTIKNLTGSGTLATGTDGSQTLTLTNANFSGIISGSDALVTTANTVILTGNNTYIGGSILQGGTIGVGNNSALGTQSIAVTGSVKMYAVGAAITLPNAIGLDSNNLTILNNPGGVQTLTLSGAITGNGGIIMSGTSTLTLSGNNSYTGNTTLNSGELVINSNNSIGTGTLIFNGGALTASANATLTNYTTGSATAGVTFRADAGVTLTLGGGTETLTGSTLSFGSPGFTGTVVIAPSAANGNSGANLNVNAGTLRDGNGILETFLANDIVTVAVGAKLDLNNFGPSIHSLLGGGNITTGTNAAEQLTLITANFSGIISGSGQLLTNSNSTTVILSGANTYSGPTTLAGGTIGLGNNSALSTANISLTANTSLYAAAADHTLANNISLASTKALTVTNDPNGAHNLTLSGNITGAGGLIMNGSGSLILSGSGNNYSGNTTINSGTVVLAATQSLGTGTVFFNGGTITASGNKTVSNINDTNATSPITFLAAAGTTLTIGGTFNTGTKDINFGNATNTGTISFQPGSGVFAFATNYNVNGGTLLDSGGSLGSVLSTEYVTIASGATVDFNSNNGAIGDLLGSGTVKTGTNANETLTVTLANFSGNITGSGKFVTQSGSSITLSGASNYTGGSTFAGGTVGAANDAALSTGPISVTANTTLYAASANHTLPNAIAINANETLTLQDDPAAAHNLTLNGPVSGNGTLAMTGNGTLTLNASLTVNTLTIGNASTPSKVVLGVGPLTSKIASLTLNSTSQLDITNDKLIIRDTSFSRPADITQLQNEIASSSIYSSVVALINASAGRNEVAVALADDAVLKLPTFGGLPVDLNSILIAPELLGDSNFDGKVDLTDLNAVLNHLGTTTPNWTDGNFDNAATIDLNDLNDVLNNLGATYASSTASPATPTPEPASLSLLALTIPLLLKRRPKTIPPTLP